MELLLNSEKVSKKYFYPRYASFEQPYYSVWWQINQSNVSSFGEFIDGL